MLQTIGYIYAIQATKEIILVCLSEFAMESKVKQRKESFLSHLLKLKNDEG